MNYIGCAILIIVCLGVSTIGFMLLLNYRDLTTRLVRNVRTNNPFSDGSVTMWPGALVLILIGLIIVATQIAKIIRHS